jgi:hypothetical protein
MSSNGTFKAARAVAALVLLAAGSLAAQTSDRIPAHDPSDRLREVLPADVAERVLAKIAETRARQLPTAALEQRALKFAARGVAPADIEQSVQEHATRLANAQEMLAQARSRRPAESEVEAGAEALRQGVSGEQVSALAKSSPSGRELTVPLHVIGSLVARGLPSDSALLRVQERLAARASDRELQQLPEQANGGLANRPAEVGRELGNTKRAGAGGAAGGAGATGAGAPPAGVPSNAGTGSRPQGGKPAGTPPTGRRP